MSKTKRNDPDELKAKLSKKIVELSTVVQVLFTRNHERELELMATRKCCEDEVKRVVEEGKSKLKWLEKQLDDLERFRTLLEMKTEECERTKATVETLNAKQLEAERKVNERGIMLNDALAEIENLKKEIAIRSPEELDKLRREKHRLTNELADGRTNLKEQTELVKDLRSKVHVIEASLKGMVSENDSLKNECSRLQEELTGATDEIRNLSQCLQDARRQGERAFQRTRKLEESNKHVTAEKRFLTKYNEQLSEQVNKLLMEQQFRDKSIVTKQIRPSSPRQVEITAPSSQSKAPPIQVIYLMNQFPFTRDH